jgi:hypothetical protein
MIQESHILNIINTIESKYGAAGVLQAGGQSIAQRQALRGKKHLPSDTNLGKVFGIDIATSSPDNTGGLSQQQKTLAATGLSKAVVRGGSQFLKKQAGVTGANARSGLQYLQKQAGHKGPIPSNKPSWADVGRHVGKQALSYHSPIGLGLTAGLDALVPGLGFVSRAIQQTLGDQKGK